MKILVTGGAGYIGSHTVKELLRNGFETVVFDNFSSGRREFAADGEVIAADLMDLEAIKSAFRPGDIVAVLHFASLIQVGESYLDPRKYYGYNLTTTMNLLEAMLEAGTRTIVFSSSAAVYGEPREIPIPESHPMNPINPYGQTKFFIEKILQDYDRAYGLKFISLRYFNAAGADPDGRLGEIHDPESHLIPNIMLSLLGRKRAFEVFGTDFPTPDGTAIRDYVHVSDLASAHVLALRRLLSCGESGFFNLGSGTGFSVLDVMRKIEETTGRKIPAVMHPRRRGDVPILLASKEKAEQELGWKRLYSSLESIVETAWKWHSRRP